MTNYQFLKFYQIISFLFLLRNIIFELNYRRINIREIIWTFLIITQIIKILMKVNNLTKL